MKQKITFLLAILMSFMMQFSFAQERTVSGTVTSVGDGIPIPGVNVIV
ncbi:MAG: hypothetical protein IMY67_08265, partial [Bacteroidetes bacterium]|nr:hypothetical protein [Bacteroidota bacterium]